ncbi:MAG: energy transducer TonB [Bryobacterales bacterium]|nr:energy transducer TonB [Bryobacterales bacterium]
MVIIGRKGQAVSSENGKELCIRLPAAGIHFSFRVAAWLREAVHQGAAVDSQKEIGGILIGTISKDVRALNADVELFIPILSSSGRLYRLSESELSELRAHIETMRLSSLTVIGLYRTHCRPGLALDQEDEKLTAEFLREPGSFFLILKPDAGQELRAALFLRGEESISRHPALIFPFEHVEPDKRIRDDVQSAERITDQVQPDERITNHVQRAERIANHVQPADRITDQVQPDDRISDEVQPDGRIADQVPPDERMIDHVQPDDRISDEVQPDGRIADQVPPYERMTDHVEPDERMADYVQPAERTIDQVQPDERMADYVQPAERITDQVPPDERMPDHLQPDERITGHAWPAERITHDFTYDGGEVRGKSWKKWAAAAAVAALLAGVLLSGRGWVTRHKIAKAPEIARITVAPAAPAALHLRAANELDHMRITWDQKAANIGVGAGTLLIRDGGTTTQIPLDNSLLKAGSVQYYPKSSTVRFELRIGEASDVILVAGARPSQRQAAREQLAERKSPILAKPLLRDTTPTPPLGISSTKPVSPPTQAGVSQPAAAETEAARPIDSDRSPEPITHIRKSVEPEISPGIDISSQVTIRVRVSIDDQGRVVQAEALTHGGPRVDALAQSAVNAARLWVFEPAQRAGRNVPSEAILAFDFGRGKSQTGSEQK